MSRVKQRTGIERQKKSSPRNEPRAIRLRDIATWAGILCATLIAYLPALRGALLWDDDMHVTRVDLRSLHGLWRIWFDLGATQQYYPLLHSAFWLEHRIWGDTVLGYHLVNVALHALSACLVVLIVRRLSLPGARLAGFLFALHPVCVEAVAWVSEQKSTLSGAFCLAAALLYLRYDQDRRKPHYYWALALFALALMSKTVTATLPAVLLVIFWWQRGRIEWKRDVRPLVPWFALAIPAGIFTAWVEKNPDLIGAHGAEYALTPLQHILLAGRVPWFYLSKLLWPSNLMFIYPRWDLDPGQWLSYALPLATVAVLAALLLLARKRRGPLAAALIFCGVLFPVLGFLNVYPFRYSFVADHFQYLASLAILIPAAGLITALARRIPARAAGAIVLPAVLLTTLGAATWRQSAWYSDYETLFRNTVARNPGGHVLHNNLGVQLMLMPGGIPEAVARFEAAVRLKPDNAEYHNNLGLALASTPGRLDDAMKAYQTALRLDPHYQAAHLNLGLALMSAGRRDEAIAEYKIAIREYRRALDQKKLARDADEDYWQAHLNLGIAYAQVPGYEADAIAEFRTALRIKPEAAQAHFRLGNTFHKMGRLEDAIAEYRASLEIEPESTEVRYELAYALAQIPGRVPEAIAECNRIFRINPNDGPAHELMASLMAFQAGQSRR